MPRKASPLSSNNHRYFTWSYIFICHISWVLLGVSCMIWVFACFALCSKYWILAGHTLLREPKIILCLLYASLKFLEPWICSSTSLISFWARCALLILNKCSHDSRRFIWELVNFWNIFSLASLRLFWEKEILCSCSSLKFVWAHQKQHIKIVAKW